VAVEELVQEILLELGELVVEEMVLIVVLLEQQVQLILGEVLEVQVIPQVVVQVQQVVKE